MPEKLRIGVLGLTHDHIWGELNCVESCPDAEIVSAADAHAPLLTRVEQLIGCPVCDNPRKMLDEQTTINAVWLFSDNAANVGLAELAAARGLHIMTEKPMAHSLAGADRMLAAAKKNNVRLMINWPFAWWPQMQHALAIAQSGEIGDIWQVKYRAAHEGPRELGCSGYFCDWLYDADRNGGGAMMDYCCYGALLARVLLGVPARVYGTRGRLCKEDITVEDNGMIVMSYPKAIAVSEGSWTQIGKLSSYVTMIYGTKGTLMVEPRHGGRLLRATSDEPDGVEVDVPALPSHLQNSCAHFVHSITTAEPFMPLCEENNCRDAQEILEAGLRSADQGSEVTIPIA